MPIPNAEYRFLGPTGLRVSSISLGGWITTGGNLQMAEDHAATIFDAAYKAGINYFDTAEGYGNGDSEKLFGNVIKKLGWKRTDYVISTKLFWGGTGINDRGLSRKHLIEGMNRSLENLQMDYVDVIFAHRCDKFTPMEEIVRGFTQLILDGKAHYWGTSMWTAYEIEKAQHCATKYGLIAPVVEQPLYNLIDREYYEKELTPILKDYGYGTTVFSPLATGLLTGKYTVTGAGPEGSRYSSESQDKDESIKGMYNSKFSGAEAAKNFEKIQKFAELAQSIGVKPAPLALAWLLKDKTVSTVIIGATKPEQVLQNLEAYEVLPKVTDEVYEKIEAIFDHRYVYKDNTGRLGA